MFLLFTAMTVCHDGSAGYGDAEANCIARAVERQLLLCDALMRIVVARLHMAGRRVPSHASYH